MTTTGIDRRGTRAKNCHVLVIGGGAAGLAAAVTAARLGAKVILVERYGFMGGGAVAGMSGTICGLYYSTEDQHSPPRIAVDGFPLEFINRLEGLGGLTPPVRYGRTFTRVHDPAAWRVVADRLAAESGVEVMLHSTVDGVLLDDADGVLGVVVTSVEGRFEILADRTIDASGDASVMAMAGRNALHPGREQLQNPTMMFRIMGVNVGELMSAMGGDTIVPPWVEEAIKQQRSLGMELPRSKVFLFPTPRDGEILCNATRLSLPNGEGVDTTSVEDLTCAEQLGREQALQYAEFFREYMPGCSGAFLNDFGVQVGVRQSRQIEGQYTLSEEDVVQGARFEDGIASSPWPIELHKGERPSLYWLENEVYEIPFRAFVPLDVKGVLAAGRCLSAEPLAMASARVTAQCFQYGEAIGLASLMILESKQDGGQIDGKRLRQRLQELRNSSLS
jgi:hypothetical protein